MKKILSILTAIIIFAASPSYAFEKAVPMDFIFKGGDFREHMIMVIDAPLSARIAGPDGSHFYIDFTGRCELQNTETDDNGIETYSAAPNTVTVRSSAEKTGNGSLAAGLIYEPVTSSLAWLVHSTGPAGTGERWTEELTESEYQFIGFQTTITADVGTNAVLVQYAGDLPDTKEIVLEITDADATEILTRKLISTDDIPGYFQISGGGILAIESAENVDGIRIISYEWVKEPLL